jgi:hypothetical protein
MDRVYARMPQGPVKIEAFLEALKKGQTFATNGPLLDFSLGGQEIGGELKLDGSQQVVPFHASLQSIVPLDHWEVVCNGKVVQSLALRDPSVQSAGPVETSSTVSLTKSGWCLVRASSDRAEYPVLDNYVYATTSPIYVTIAGRKPRSVVDAKYFVAWMGRVIEKTLRYPDWNSPVEKESVLMRLATAKVVYQQMQ